MKNLILIFLYFSLFYISSVFSQTSGQYTHDGFFMRFLLGGSSSIMSMNAGSNAMGIGDMELSGLSVTFRFQIGAEIAENLIAFGEVGAIAMSDPKLKIAGKTYDTKETLASTSDIGAGLTYYFMPVNIYLTGSILASTAEIEYTEGSTTNRGESDYGLGLFAAAGKEWWVGEDWALGVSIYAAYSDVPDKGNSKVNITTTTFGVAFSATFQ